MEAPAVLSNNDCRPSSPRPDFGCITTGGTIVNIREADSLRTKNGVGNAPAVGDCPPPAAARAWSILAIVTWAAVLCLPCIIVGVPNNGDAITHTMYQYYFSSQLWTGELYPRWLAEANKGYGSPMFFFQYPFPYYVTALLRPMLAFTPTATREGRELGIFCFLMLAGSGLSAWVWFRNRCGVAASVIGALVYMSLPYLIGQVLYARAAMGELATFVWMPLILALCDRLQSARFQVFGAIAVAFALLVLSNAMYTAMFLPVIIVYAAAATRGDMAALFKLALALVCGIGIAGVYVIPFVAFKHFLDLDALSRYHLDNELGRSFLYFTRSDVQSQFLALLSLVWAGLLTLFVGFYIWRLQRGLLRLALLVVIGLGLALFIPGLGPALVRASGMALTGFDRNGAYAVKMLITALLTLAIGLLAYCRITRGNVDPRDHTIVVVACVVFVLMLPWSAWLWRAFPATSVIQFPWRLCSILTVVTASLFAIALDDWFKDRANVRKSPSLAAMAVLTIATLIGGNVVWRVDTALRFPSTTQVDAERWVEYPFVAIVYPPAVRNFATMLGTSPDNYDVARTPVENGIEARCVEAGGSVSVTRLNPRRLAVSARCEKNALIRVGQIYFPLWTIVRATRSEPSLTLHSSPDGLIEVLSPFGKDEFELVFDGGFAEKAGIVVSAISIAIVLTGFAVAGFRRHRSPTYEPGGGWLRRLGAG